MKTCPLASWLTVKGMNQRQLARKLQAPESSVSAYIAGRRGFRLPRFQKLARITGIPVGDLVAWTASHQS